MDKGQTIVNSGTEIDKNNNKKDKNKTNNTNDQVKDDKAFPYRVKICDIWGTTTKDQVIFGVQRFIEGSNVYLYNEKMGFKEPLPEDSDEFKQYKIEDIDKRLKELDEQLKKKNDNSNQKDIRQEIKQLSSWKNSLLLQGRGSYMRMDLEGKPYFEFDRQGNFRMPVFKNIDKSLLYTPSESKIKLGSELIKENEEKNGDPNKGLRLMNILLTVILVICVGLFGYLSYKASALPDECSANLDKASVVFINSANKFANAANTLDNITSKVYIKKDDVSINVTPEVVN